MLSTGKVISNSTLGHLLTRCNFIRLWWLCSWSYLLLREKSGEVCRQKFKRSSSLSDVRDGAAVTSVEEEEEEIIMEEEEGVIVEEEEEECVEQVREPAVLGPMPGVQPRLQSALSGATVSAPPTGEEVQSVARALEELKTPGPQTMAGEVEDVEMEVVAGKEFLDDENYYTFTIVMSW